MSTIFENPSAAGDNPQRKSAAVERDEHSAANQDVLRGLYANLLTCLMARERALALLREGRTLSSNVNPTGAEASEVGATYELQPGDSLAAWQHDVFTHLLRGASLPQVFAQLLGHTTPKEIRDNLASRNIIPSASTLAGQLNVAAGVALACRQQARPNVVVALCGNGFAALGAWHDAAQLAAECRLPLVFVIDSGRRREQDPDHWFGPAEDLGGRAHAYGFPGITVDGNDTVAVFRVTQESIHRARSGAGPTLIECKSTAPEAATEGLANRDREGQLQGSRPDPLAHMEHYLGQRDAWRSSWKQKLVKQIADEMQQAITLALSQF